MRCPSTDGTVEPSAGLSSSLVLKKRGILSTDRLTRAKFQAIMTTFSTGEKKNPYIFPIFTRSGDEWLVVDDKQGQTTELKAWDKTQAYRHRDPEGMGQDPVIPPSTGWMYIHRVRSYGVDGHQWDQHAIADTSLTCTLPAVSSPCSVTLRLSGRAKDFQGKCNGEYKDTGLRSMGRQVTFIL